MFINPYLFILARSPSLVIWDYKNHKQFELNSEYATRLVQLINTPDQFNITYAVDVSLLDAGIFIPVEERSIEWGWDELSKIFHIGTKNIPCECIPTDVHEWSAQYLTHCNEVLATPAPQTRFLDPPTTGLITLPPPSLPTSSETTLGQTLINRKTCRSFSNEAVSLKNIATLLYLSLGYLKEREDNTDDSIPDGLGSRRSSPSGGGLNACEGYLYVRNVSGLKAGIYFYHPDIHALRPINPLQEEPLGLILGGQHFINPLPFGLFITCRFDKLWWKYEHSRAYRMAFVEAGHLSQTLQLVATGLGLNTWLTGALTDDRVETLLGLENSAEQPLLFVGCGHGDGQVQCKELNALINSQDPR